MIDEIRRLARPEILAMSPYRSARTEGAQTNIRAFLDANENPYPPYPGDQAQLALNRYPEPQPGHLLALFAEHFDTSRERLLLTRGADEAIDLLVRAFCTAGQDGILICPPTFPVYAVSADIQDATVHEVPLLSRRGFQLDVDGILAAQARNPTTKLVFVCTPNNPTGNLMRREEVLAVCEGLVGRALIIADQTYVEYSGEAPLNDTVDTHPNLVALRTLSKEYSLAGERVGVTIAHPDAIAILRRVLAPYPLAQSAIAAVTKAMTAEGVAHARENIRRIVAERGRVQTALARFPYTQVLPSDANYLLVRVAEPKLLLRAMRRARIKVRDRSDTPGIEGCVRISIGTPQENDSMLETFADYAHRVAELRKIARLRGSP